MSSSKITEAEWQTVIYHFNNTCTGYPGDKAVHWLFTDIAHKSPDAIALLTKQEQVTYRELDEASNKIAHFLRSQGVGDEQLVALMIDSSVSMAVHILGILKAGGAYVALNPDFPINRLKTIVDDTRAAVALVEKKYLQTINRLQWECPSLTTYLCVDTDHLYDEEEPTNELMKKELWDYIGEEATDDISGGGWVDSYTGEDFSRAVMDEYGDNILEKLHPLLGKEHSVLDIGCSSGISMLRLAPLVKEYLGVDLSHTILEKTKREVAARGIANVTLKCMPAHEIDRITHKKFDVIIINSVIQCFNGYNYLRQVLRKALYLLKEDGSLFIGDIMDQDRREALVTSLEEFKRTHGDKGHSTKVDWSNELFVSRRFLEDLCHDYSEIQEIVFSNKIGTLRSELSEYRYDALLKINKSGANQRHPLEKRHKYQFDRRSLEAFGTEALPRRGGSRNLAYVTYTSGSTGRPKGVMIEHRSIVRLVRNTNYIDITPRDRLIQTAPLAFDASTFELWGPLLNGASLYLTQKEDLLYLDEFARILNQQQVSICWLTTSLFNRFVDEDPFVFSSLKTLLVGGETISPKHVDTARRANPNLTLINCYGPTENTTFSTCFRIDDEHDAPIPIGTPISNSECYILDENMQVLPVESIGELYVAGDGLARGYLNDQVLTGAKFLDHPFKAGSRMYRTGDMARWMPDGKIEFLGRRDSQVKVRGFRIELDEIENGLARVAPIKEAVVIARNDQHHGKELCAYVSADSDIDARAIKRALALSLPSYMIPLHILQVPRMPLTPNGKIDKKALPEPRVKDVGNCDQYIAPRNPIQSQLEAIWKEVLALRRIGIRDNFFEIGGHSLKATRVVSRIAKEIEVPVSIRDMFNYPTIEELGKAIRQKTKQVYEPIRRLPRQEHYDTSHAQRRLWFLDQLEEDLIAYNVPEAYILQGPLDQGAFERSFDTIVERHEILRTTFISIDGEPRQRVHKYSSFECKLNHLDLSAEKDPTESAKQFVEREAGLPFSLENGPLLRAHLVKLSKEKHLFLFTMHHIISDAWSIAIFLHELKSLYNAFHAGEAIPLRSLSIQYKDYAAWQNKELNEVDLEPHQEYWLKQFEGSIPVLNLYTDYPRPALRTFSGDTVSTVLDKDLSERLQRHCDANGVSLFMLLVALVKALLHRYTGQEDIVIGSPIAGRDHNDLENQLGLYINNLSLRSQFKGSDSFTHLLTQIKESALEAYAHQVYPFDRLVEDLDIVRDMSRSPLFDLVVVLQNADMTAAQQVMSDLEMIPYDTGFRTSKIDVRIEFRETRRGLGMVIDFNTDLFARERMERMLTHFATLAFAALEDPSLPVEQLTYMPRAEVEQILQGFNQTESRYANEKTLVQLFEEQAARTPDAIAVVFDDQVVSYRELNETANRLAHYLRDAHSVTPGDVLALMSERSEKTVIGILGILKSGATYLPLDTKHPEERRSQMLAEAEVKVLLTDSEWMFYVGSFQGDLLALDLQLSDLPTRIENPEPVNKADDIAYIIYTSGSSGAPKGVLITHQSISDRMQHFVDCFQLSEEDNSLQLASLGFDVSMYEIFMAFAAGARVTVVGASAKDNIPMLLALLERHQVSIATLPPAYLRLLDKRPLPALEKIITTGEAAPFEETLFYAKTNEVYNGYGPTETCIGASVYKVDPEDHRYYRKLRSIPIGRPFANTTVYILDKNQQPVPVGFPGELYVGGVGLSAGYLKNPDLTREKFVANPLPVDNDGILYRTGDIARWNNQGVLEYIGRIDEQVQIRGIRVEPGEIENILLELEYIKEAIVVAHQGDTVALAAYIVSEHKLNVSDIRAYLKTQLPAYMIPEYFISLDTLPLTSNGKVDREALPEPQQAAMNDKVAHVAPRNDTERNLADLWKEVLDTPRISVHENFFELGGHSLKGIQVLSLAEQRFGMTIPVRDFYNHPTIAELSQLVATEEAHDELLIHFEREGNVERNLFLIPPVAGSAICFRNLADRLRPHFNCYGIQYRGFEQGERFDESIEDMAESFAEAIRDVQQEGTVHLLGYSMGGIVAFEVAKRLEAEGLVTRLVILDSPTTQSQLKDDIAFEEDVEQAIASWLPERASDVLRSHLKKLVVHNSKLLDKYQVQGLIKGAITALEAKDNSVSTAMEEWAMYTVAPFTHRHVEGEHFSVLDAKYLPVLVEEIVEGMTCCAMPGPGTGKTELTFAESP